MMHKEEMGESKMEGMMNWWEHIPEDKKKAIMKAKLEMKIKKATRPEKIKMILKHNEYLRRIKQ